MKPRMLIPILTVTVAWSCVCAQDPPASEDNSVSTRFSLATIDDATFYGERSGSQPAVLNQVLVEPAFAQFFARFGRYVSYRGRDAVDTEIKLMATVHNLGKLLDHRRRHPAPAT